jgi:hypothetical protein
MDVRHCNYSFNFQGQYEVARKLKGPFYKRDDRGKSAENLCASLFKLDLSDDFQPNKSRWTVPLNTRYVVHIQAGTKEIG